MAEDLLEDDDVVELIDDEGNTIRCVEELVYQVDDVRFAVLVPVDQDGAEEEGSDAIICKIETDEEGMEEYVSPTDEEFEMALDAYEDMLKAEGEEDK